MRIIASSLPDIRYNRLNIIQKINVKANVVAANVKYKSDIDGWMPMHRAMANYKHDSREYSSPFKYSFH